MRRQLKRDWVELDIVSTLRSVGAKVWRINERGLPDLLVCYREQCYLLEIKSPGGHLTPAQLEFLDQYDAHNFFIVRNSAEALAAIGAVSDALAGD